MWRAAILIGLGVLLSGAACAADTYPGRPITIYNPYPPGSISDIGARVLAQLLATDLSQPVRVVNATGGGGAVAAGELQEQPSDGYSLLWIVASDLAYVIASKELSYTAQDFRGIALLEGEANAVIARVDDKRFGNFADMLSYAHSHPGALTIAGSGAGETRKGYEEMRDATHIQGRYIPYAGGAPMMAALLGGHVDIAVTAPSNALENDRLHPIVILTNAQTYPPWPSVPTIGAAGFAVDSELLRGIFVKRDTPPAIIDRLVHATQAALQTAAWQQFLAKFLQSATARGPAELDAYVGSLTTDWDRFLHPPK